MVHASIPLVTAGVAVVLATMQIVLMSYAASGRAKYAVGLGDGGQEALLRRIRMHGNLAENAPIFLILLGLVELSGDWSRTINVIAVTFVVVRIAHVIGLVRSSGSSAPRIIGALGTVISIGLLALLLGFSVAERVLAR